MWTFAKLLGPSDNLIAALATYDNLPTEFFFDFNKKETLHIRNKQLIEAEKKTPDNEKCLLEPPLLDELTLSNGVYQVTIISIVPKCLCDKIGYFV